MRRLWLVAVLFLVPDVVTAEDRAAAYQQIAIAADHPAASAAGLEVHRAGGNVVDVAAAVGFALSVVRPESAGLGGGGFMVIWDAEQRQAVALDYRERAPAAAGPDMFLNADGTADPSASRTGAKAVAVPTHVAGLCYAVETYGRLPLKTVLAPAIRLATQGVPLDAHAVGVRKETLARFAANPALKQQFPTFYRMYLNDGAPPQLGQVATSPQAELLKQIAADGPAAFYSGNAAAALLREVARGGGILTADDLAATRPIERTPLTADYAGGALVTMPPPSSGGVALVEMLHILAAFDAAHPELAELQNRNSTTFRHLLTEAMKHAFADRAAYLGDPDFGPVPVARLTSPDYAAALAAKIDPARTFPPPHYGRVLPAVDGGTTHFSIIDAAGNAVACTETINTTYGSYVVVPETGLLLNNEIDDFAAAPGVPNAFGLVQSAANAVAPGKRPLSSMTPTLLVRDGGAVLAVGASGGPRIITATAQVLLNRLRFGLAPQAAVTAPRQHHQWLPDVLELEPPLWNDREPLARLGHTVKPTDVLGVSQLVTRDPAGLHAACDPRKGGAPAGE